MQSLDRNLKMDKSWDEKTMNLFRILQGYAKLSSNRFYFSLTLEEAGGLTGAHRWAAGSHRQRPVSR